MTAGEYIKRYPRTILAQRLKKTLGEKSRKEIHISSGILSTSNKQSKLSLLLKSTGSNYWIAGGRAGQRASQGSIFAVYKK